jgi:hypothetical protein
MEKMKLSVDKVKDDKRSVGPICVDAWRAASPEDASVIPRGKASVSHVKMLGCTRLHVFF